MYVSCPCARAGTACRDCNPLKKGLCRNWDGKGKERKRKKGDAGPFPPPAAPPSSSTSASSSSSSSSASSSSASAPPVSKRPKNENKKPADPPLGPDGEPWEAWHHFKIPSLIEMEPESLMQHNRMYPLDIGAKKGKPGDWRQSDRHVTAGELDAFWMADEIKQHEQYQATGETKLNSKRKAERAEIARQLNPLCSPSDPFTWLLPKSAQNAHRRGYAQPVRRYVEERQKEELRRVPPWEKERLQFLHDLEREKGSATVPPASGLFYHLPSANLGELRRASRELREEACDSIEQVLRERREEGLPESVLGLEKFATGPIDEDKVRACVQAIFDMPFADEIPPEQPPEPKPEAPKTDDTKAAEGTAAAPPPEDAPRPPADIVPPKQPVDLQGALRKSKPKTQPVQPKHTPAPKASPPAVSPTSAGPIGGSTKRKVQVKPLAPGAINKLDQLFGKK
mmetsp:Transcript_12980/g.25386  ORF Transcript_12980/g.25386 Transcript_12980/m.25386 type:complete len:454 (-) Transcript_12980:252-1613(-)